MNIALLNLNKKTLALLLSVTFVVSFFVAGMVKAADFGGACVSNDDCTLDNVGSFCDPATKTCVDAFGTQKVEDGLGGTLGTQDLITTVTQIINVALGLLGVVAVVIILIGGFKWMTAGGNEEKVGEARKLIFAGIIGLAIILASWAIARFVISNLASATGGGNVPTIE